MSTSVNKKKKPNPQPGMSKELQETARLVELEQYPLPKPKDFPIICPHHMFRCPYCNRAFRVTYIAKHYRLCLAREAAHQSPGAKKQPLEEETNKNDSSNTASVKRPRQELEAAGAQDSLPHAISDSDDGSPPKRLKDESSLQEQAPTAKDKSGQSGTSPEQDGSDQLAGTAPHQVHHLRNRKVRRLGPKKTAERPSSRIGKSYQIAHLPSSDEWTDKTDNQEKEEEKEEGGTVLWDCNRETQETINFIERMSGSKRNCNPFALLETLHKSDYNIQEVEKKLQRRSQSNQVGLVTRDFTKEQERLFGVLITKYRKNFSEVATQMNVSVGECLVHYYGIKRKQVYLDLKRQLKNEVDVCTKCNDGGDLIRCDKCARWYHLKCLNPPLKKIPQGHWLCPGCKG